jgi:hypothetical protein
MEPFFVIIQKGCLIEHLVVNARYHEEAEREALLMLNLDYSDIDAIRACPIVGQSKYFN